MGEEQEVRKVRKEEWKKGERDQRGQKKKMRLEEHEGGNSIQVSTAATEEGLTSDDPFFSKAQPYA